MAKYYQNVVQILNYSFYNTRNICSLIILRVGKSCEFATTWHTVVILVATSSIKRC